MRIFTRCYLLITLFIWLAGMVSAQSVRPSAPFVLPSSSGNGLISPDLPLRVDPQTGQYQTVEGDPKWASEAVRWAKDAKNKVRGPHSWIPQSQVVFRPNVGQIVGTDGKPQPQIKFEVGFKNLHLYFAQDRVTYVFKKMDEQFMQQTAQTLTAEQKAAMKDALQAFKQGEIKPDANEPYQEVQMPTCDLERIDLEFVGANPNAELIADKKAGSYVNYYLPHIMETRTKVDNYRMLVYKNIYPNIDLVFYGAGSGVKYDFVVHPGGNPQDIKVRYLGAQSVSLDAKGALVVKGKLGELTEEKPFSYQEITNEPRFQKGTCESEFVVNGNYVSFKLKDYDPKRLLVIDPTVAWSQFYGGTGTEYALACAVNNDDELHVTGLVLSTNFPVVFPLQATLTNSAIALDAFVMKLQPDGLLTNTWATYYGGGAVQASFTSNFVVFCNGNPFFRIRANIGYPRGLDVASDIKIDPYGNSIIVGTTTSDNLLIAAPGNENPTTAAGKFDLFVARIDQGGGLNWSRYYGGSENEGAGDLPTYIVGNAAGCGTGAPNIFLEAFFMAACAVDGNGDVAITAGTNSNNLPRRRNDLDASNVSDVMVAKFSSLGAHIWSRYIGGNDWDFGNGICVDQANHIYVTGATISDNFPVRNEFQSDLAGGFDAFITKLDTSSRILMSSYAGGPDWENVIVLNFGTFLSFYMYSGDVDVDPLGDPVLAGYTESDEDIATPGAFDVTMNVTDAFLMKINQNGGLGAKKWGTYLGGTVGIGVDMIYDIHHYADGKIAIAGQTYSTDFPTRTPLQAALGNAAGNSDGFITILNGDGSGPLVYSTYIGGNNLDALFGVAVHPTGILYTAGRAASTNAFLTTPIAAPRNANAGGSDVLIYKFNEPEPPVASCTGNFNLSPVKIGILKYKVDLAVEYPQTLAALDSKFKNYVLTEYTTPTAITPASLALIDVLIIPEIEDPTVDYTLFTGISATLTAWVNGGGTVIFLGSNNRPGLNNGNFANVIFNTGLLAGNQAAHSRLVEVGIITDNTTCLTDRVENPLFQSPNTTLYSITSPNFTSIFNVGDPTSVGVRTLGVGKVFIIGYDYESYDDNTSQILANAVNCYQTTAGRKRMQISYNVIPASCRNRNDGSIELKVFNAPLPISYNWSDGFNITKDRTGLTANNYTVTITAGGNNACQEVIRITVPGCDSLGFPPSCTLMNPDPIAVAGEQRNDTIAYCSNNPPNTITIQTNDSTRYLGCGDYFIQTTPHNLPVVAEGKGDTVTITQEFNADNTYENIGIGFPFTYYCNKYHNVGINPHGFLSFTGKQDATNTVPQNLPSDTLANNIFAFHWVWSMREDRDGDPFANIQYIRDTTAGNRKFILKMENMRYTDIAHIINGAAMTTGTWTATVVLYEGDSIDVFITRSDAQPNQVVLIGPPFFQNPTNVPFSYPKTMALENATGRVGKAIVAGRNQTTGWSANNEAYRLRPFSPGNTLTYRWFRRNAINNGLTEIAGANGPSLTVNPIPTDSARFIVQIQHGRNCFTRDSVFINVDRPSVPGQVLDNVTICPGSNATLTVSGHTGQVVFWESSTDDFNANIVTINSTTTTIEVNNVTQTTAYRAAIRNGSCNPVTATAATVTVSVPEIGEPDITNVLCNGGATGSITVPVSAGTAPYTFRWYRGTNVSNGVLINGETSATLANQRAGAYSVIVIDQNTCRDTLNNIVLTEPTRITTTLVRRENLRCSGGADGIIDVRAEGGSPPYTFRYTGDANPTNESIRNTLSAGCYTVTVTDINGCLDSLVNICLTQPTPISFRVASKQDVSCFGGNNGQITLDITGGVPNYQFTWNPPVSQNEDARNLVAGTYIITVCDRDGSGCCKDTTVVIDQPTSLRLNSSDVSNVSCFGANDGAINIDVQGGTQPYTFAWGPNVRPQDRNREDLTQLAPGRYCVTVTDAKGCILNYCGDVTQPQRLGIIFNQLVNPTCHNSTDGCATAIAQGGNGGYRYVWAIDGSDNPTNCTLRGDIFYKVTVIDSRNCSYTDSVKLIAPLPINIGINQFQNVTCNGNNNGIINIDVSGGTPPFTYDWADLDIPNEPEDRQNLPPGNYCVTATDANGCTRNRCFMVSQPDDILIEVLNQVNPSCNGQSNGLIDIRVTGGNAGTKQFFWTRDGQPFSNNRTEDLFNVPAGRYEVQVTDPIGCIQTQVVTLTQPDPLTITISQIDHVLCFGQCTGKANVLFEGGTQPFVYQWSDNPNAPQDRENLCAGSYVLSLTDANGCTATANVTITQPTQLAVQLNRLTQVTCYDAKNATIDITPIGGAGNYTYLWNTTPPQTTQDITNGAPDTVQVTLTDGNGCSVVRKFKITQPDSIRITVVSARRPSCNGASNGSIQLSVSGGTPINNPGAPYRYTWTRNGSFISSNQNLTNLPAGNYCVTVTDANNCTKTQCINLTQPTALSASIQVNATITCPGGLTGQLEAMPVGGTPPYTYRWNNNNGFNQKVFTNLGAGSYNVVVTDSGGCTAIAIATLTQPAPLNVSVLQLSNVRCNGEKSGAITVAVVGGTSPYEYTWNGTTLNDPVISEVPTLNLLSSGTYSVLVKDANGCEKLFDNIVITQPQQGISIETQIRRDVSCNGKNDGRIEIRPFGGTEPLRAEWSGPGVNTAGTALLNIGAGTYCVTVTDNVGCIKEECYTISQPNELILQVTKEKNVSCNGQNDGEISVQAQGGNPGGFLYTWSSLKNSNLPRNVNALFNLKPDVYQACVIDQKGCFACVQIVITEPEPITLSTLVINPVNCNGQDNGSIQVEAQGGGNDGLFEYNWAGPNGYSGVGPAIAGLKGGDYTLTVTKGTCNQKFVIKVAEPGALVARLREKRDVSCKGGSDGSINLDIEGGTEPYLFSWNPAAPNIEDINNLTAGEYNLVVSDARGCTANFSTTISEPDSVIIVLQGISDVQCNGENTGRIKVNVTGGTEPYRFIWNTNSPGDTTGEISDKPAGFYTLTVFDAKNCVSGARTYEIKEPLPLVANVTTLRGESCKGANDGVIQIQVEGGTQPIRYVWTFNGNADDTTTVSNSTVDKTDLEPGSYHLILIGQGGCFAETTLVVAPADTMRITIDEIVHPVCGANCTGRIFLSVEGGEGPYTFIWQDPGSPSTEDRGDLCQGTYCLRIIDANNCQKDTCFVLENQGGEAVIAGLKPTFCAGEDSVLLSGTPEDGVFTGEGQAVREVDGQYYFYPKSVTTPTTTVTYEVTVDGCVFRKEQVVNMLGAGMNAEITYTGFPVGPPFCKANAGFYVLSYTPIQSGVTAQFSGTGVTFNGVSYLFTPSGVTAGDVEITLVLVDNASQCRTTIKDTVTVSSPTDIHVVLDKNAVCPGDSVTISVPGATEYSISPTTGLSCAPNCNNLTAPIKAAPAQTTNYLVSANAGGCSVQKQVKLNVNFNQPILISAGATSVCAGTEVSLRAVSLGTYTYKWSPGNLFNDSTGANVVARITGTTTFTVVGKGTNGCEERRTIVITAMPSLVNVTSDQDTICLGSSATLNAESTQPGDFTFTWSPATGLSATTGNSVTASPKVTTVYTVTRSGGGQCNFSTIRVAVKDTLATVTGLKPLFCANEECVDLTAIPEGGTFTGSGITGNQFCPATAGVGIHNIFYTFEETDGCRISRMVTVSVQAPKPVRITNILPTYCRLTNAVTLVPEIPNSEIKFGNTVLPNNVLTLQDKPLGTHQITVTPPANSGCVKDSVYTINIVEPNTAINGLEESYCVNSPMAFLNPTPAGGQLVGKGIITQNGSFFFDPGVGPGTYSIIYFGRDAACTYSITRIVTVTGAITATASVTNATSPTAQDGSATISVQGGAPPYLYGLCSQTPDQLTSSPTITGLAPGTYCLQVRSGGCSAQVTVTIGAGSLECSAPTDASVIASEITTNAAKVSWATVQNAIVYHVDYRVVGSPTFVTVPTATNSIMLTQLACNTTYDVVVRAVCSNGGISPNTLPISFQTENCQASNCPTPTNLTAVAIDRNNVRMNWTPVAEAVNGYVISWREGQDGTIRSTTISGQNTATFIVRNLLPGKEYCFRIRSRCANNVLSGFTNFVCLTMPLGKEAGFAEETNMDISVYPNPNNGLFNIVFDSYESAEGDVVLTDVAGKTVYQRTLDIQEGGNDFSIQLPDVTTGIYLMRLSVGTHQKTIKIVVN